MLASGASYAFIVRSLAEDNAQRDERDRVTVDSVRNHCGRHFPLQNITKATYREILERRAKENAIDFVEGVATAISPIAFYETVMVRSYETLVAPDTEVDVKTGMAAALRLQALLDSRVGQPDIADLMARMNRIVAAVREIVPERYHPAILACINGEAVPVHAHIEEPEDDQAEYDPLAGKDADDEDEEV